MDDPAAVTRYGTCNLCEAICGLEFRIKDDRILSIRGDDADPFSRGHICPKAVAIKDIHEDPDRLRKPMRRTAAGWEETTWEAAFSEIAGRLASIRASHGTNSVAVYQGNPSVHNYGNLTHANNFLGLLKTRSRYSATSCDQLPHQLVAMWMFGHQLLLPIPDLDHTQHFLVLGANPMASNGSLMTVPDFRGRVKDLHARGGRMIVVDPRRTETAAVADEHHFVRPGTDVVLLFALLSTLFAEGRVKPDRLSGFVTGLDAVDEALRDFTADAAAPITGIPAGTIRRIAREFADAPSAVAYGRMGLSTQRYGSLCQWAINLLNIVTGNLDRRGGAMFTLPAVDLIKGGFSSPGHFGAWKTRVRGLPEFGGELPAAALAEEILTPGEGQVRALVTIAGNPVLSTPNGRQVEKALEGLEFMVSIDLYLNETTRHADFILPPTCGVEHDHYDLVFHHLAIRNTARYSPALLPAASGALHDWQIYNGLARAYRAALGEQPEPLAARVKKARKLVMQRLRPDQVVDLGLRFGAYGRWKRKPEGLSLKKLRAQPHGVDLGPLQPCLPERLGTETKSIRADIPELMADVARARELLVPARGQACAPKPGLRLIGRRHIRSNNSWMHNSERLVKGKDRCLLLMHPDDAATRGLSDRNAVRVRSRIGEIEAEVNLTDEMMPGVVSLPHGWGHTRDGTRLRVAQAHAGVSLNDLTDDQFLDPVSGNAAFNGVEVSVEAA